LAGALGGDDDGAAIGGGRDVVTALRFPIRRCEERDLEHFDGFGPPAHVHHCRERFARSDVVILVAVDGNDVPIGKVHVCLDRADDTALIEAAAVVEPLRGKGIGTALMHAAEELVRERGVGVVQLGVEDSNPDARRLYERLGYRSYARMDFVYEGAPVPNPGVMMRKQIGVAA
jgi:ribosomal protein S18 acetylase RimI-like enzyme